LAEAQPVMPSTKKLQRPIIINFWIKVPEREWDMEFRLKGVVNLL
jgi:hypothetical protein